MTKVDVKKSYVAALLLTGCSLISFDNQATAQNAPCTTMRKINIGVSVSPPNVVHTSVYVAKELGYFAKRCIDANIVQFEGGQSATSAAAAATRLRHCQCQRRRHRPRLKVKQIWGLAPRSRGPTRPLQSQDCHVSGKRRNPNRWRCRRLQLRMGREVLRTAKLSVDMRNLPRGHGRPPARLIASQIDGVPSGRRIWPKSKNRH